MSYFFTSESVSEGHPDKVADQISDALLDNFLAFDQDSKVACETLVTTGQVVLAGEVKSNTYIDVQDIARRTINKIGYTKGEYQFSGDSCGVISLIHEQSQDINQGVDKQNKLDQGAGDQGIMFGYACNETSNYIPLALDLSHQILKVLADFRKDNKEINYLRPDAKSQVTIEYDDNNKPVKIDTIVVSTQHDSFDTDDSIMLSKIKSDINLDYIFFGDSDRHLSSLVFNLNHAATRFGASNSGKDPNDINDTIFENHFIFTNFVDISGFFETPLKAKNLTQHFIPIGKKVDNISQFS